MPKDNLKDEIVDGELDLSLSNLTTVPVKDLMPLTKAVRLDLSCNLIKTLPDEFCKLKHLIKIDLSKNYLESLPDDFGSLINLQHLDLLGNRLTLLPVSLYKLQKLKWLDLKDNPLDEELKNVAGDCLNEAECKKCATEVVKYMSNMNQRLSDHKRQEEEKKRKQEEMRNKKEQEEADRKREERKKKKAENRKASENRKKQEAAMIENKEITEPVEEVLPETISGTFHHSAPTRSTSTCWKILKWTTILFMMIIVIMMSFSYFCRQYPSNSVCAAVNYKTHILPYHIQAETYIKTNYFPLVLKYRDNFVAGVDYIRIYIITETFPIFWQSSSNDNVKKDDEVKKFTSSTEDLDLQGKKKIRADNSESPKKKGQSDDNISKKATNNPELVKENKMSDDDHHANKETKTKSSDLAKEKVPESTKDKIPPADNVPTSKETKTETPGLSKEKLPESIKEKTHPADSIPASKETKTETPSLAKEKVQELVKENTQPAHSIPTSKETKTESPGLATEKLPESIKEESI